MRFCQWIVFVIFGGVVLRGVDAVYADPAKLPEVSISLDAGHLPNSPGYHVISGMADVDGKQMPIQTGIFLPPAYFESHDRMPIVVTLHNRDIETPGGLVFEGLGMMLAKDDADTRGSGERPKEPIDLRTDAEFIGLVPQCPEKNAWNSPTVARILDRLISKIAQAYHADDDRIYLTGFSYGASGTWAIAMQLPGRFAGIAPIAGRQTADPPNDVLKLKDVAIYLAIGTDDQSIPDETQHMRDALLAARHSKLQFKLIPGGNHWCYASVYSDPQFWDWLLAQRKGAALLPPTTRAVRTVQRRYHPEGSTLAMTSSNGILCQYWRDIPGAQIKDLTDNVAFPRFPDEQMVLAQMEIPPNQTPNFGTALRGWLQPSSSGDYTFFIASDDQGELWLSDDDHADHKKLIASVPQWTMPRDWTHDPKQQSKPVHLLADHRYYIEARQKDGGGNNNLSVAWKLPDGTLEGPIPAARLSPATVIDVPPPKIFSIDPERLPTTAGTFRLKVGVDYLGRHQTMPVVVVLPKDYDVQTKHPALVCFANETRDPNSDRAIPRPVKRLGGDSKLAAWSPLVLIAPQCPDNESWERASIDRIGAVVIDRLLHDMAIDNERVYLSGAGTGGTTVWKMSALLPSRFAAIAPICGMEVNDPQLPGALAGTEIHIITGVKDGVATDCANRMKDALGVARLLPKPEVVYEMDMGLEVADVYYGRQTFYEWLLSWRRPTGKAARQG